MTLYQKHGSSGSSEREIGRGEGKKHSTQFTQKSKVTRVSVAISNSWGWTVTSDKSHNQLETNKIR